MKLPPLMAHQQEAVAHLVGGGSHFIAHEPGLGKSRTCISALDDLGIKGRILIVAPAIGVFNWLDQFRQWGRIDRTVQTGSPAQKIFADIFVTSFDHVSRLKPTVRDKFLKHQWEVLILDEAHRLKSPTARRTLYVYGQHMKLQKAIAARAERCWLLSGTPAPNHVGELWTHLRALWPHLIDSPTQPGAMGREEFEDHFCRINTTIFGRQIVGSKNVKKLRAIIDPVFHPKREKDCVDLPNLLIDTYPLPAANKDISIADKMFEHIARAADPIDALRQEAAHLATERRILGALKAPGVADLVRTELEDQNHSKIIVFAHHRDVIADLEKRLARFKINTVTLSGKTPAPERVRHEQAFQNDPSVQVFLAQMQSAGEAITLTAASRVICAEPSWTPKDNFQAIKRAHRLGQTRQVHASFAVLGGSLDHSIMNVLVRKTRELSAVMQ